MSNGNTSAGSAAIQSPVRSLAPIDPAVARRIDLYVHATLVVFCLVFTAWAGRDLNWDLLNYHFYSGYSFFADRLDRDFMAASVQTYLNPAPQAPFYLLVASGAHSLLIGLLLAAFHSLNLVLLYEIARRTVTGDPVAVRKFAILATVLGAVTPIFWTELGTSFADVSTSVFVLGAVLLLLDPQTSQGRRLGRMLLAGLLLGSGAGLKLTNVVYVLPAALLAIAPALGARKNVKRLAAMGIGSAAGALATHGYWSYRLFAEFGNPFFPLFNGVFKSPDFPTSSVSFERFTPQSLTDALELPLRLAGLESWVYTETFAPDLRVVVLCVLLGAFILSLPWLNKSRAGAERPSIEMDALPRLVAFALAFVPLWLLTTANGRYAVGFLLLIGPILAAITWRLLGERTATRLLLLLVAAQIVHAAQAGNPRWAPARWAPTWFEAEVPERIRREPALYLAVAMQPNAFVVPWLHPDSAYVNVTGQHSVHLDAPGGGRLEKLLERYSGRVRVITPHPGFGLDPEGDAIMQDRMDAVLSRLSLRTDRGDCVAITSDASPVASSLANAEKPTPEDGALRSDRSARLTLMTCALVPGAAPAGYHHERQNIARAFDAVERTCPGLFKPAGAVLESGRGVWVRYYMGTETYLVSAQGKLHYTKLRHPTDVDLGRIADWLDGTGKMDCQPLRRP